METIYSVTIGIEPWLAVSDKLTPSLLFHITMISRTIALPHLVHIPYYHLIELQPNSQIEIFGPIGMG